MLLSRSTKEASVFKKKLIEQVGIPATSTRCPENLSRQFLTGASTFPYGSKNSSSQHIHALSTCLTLTNTLTHIDKHTHSHTYIHTHTHTHSLIPQPNKFSLYQHDPPSQTNSLTLPSNTLSTHTHTHTHTDRRTHTHAHRDIYIGKLYSSK